MMRNEKVWKWRTVINTIDYDFREIVGGMNPPKTINERGF